MRTSDFFRGEHADARFSFSVAGVWGRQPPARGGSRGAQPPRWGGLGGRSPPRKKNVYIYLYRFSIVIFNETPLLFGRIAEGGLRGSGGAKKDPQKKNTFHSRRL